MISKETVDQIFSLSRIEEVIGDFMELKKSGSNYKGLSPFRAEKTPSFVVSPSKGIWKDFSSGKGGNVISFLMAHEQFSYPEALEYLARKYHVEIQREKLSSDEGEKRSQRDALFLIQDKAKDFFIDQLFNSQEGQTLAINYIRERKLSVEVVKKFDLGYSLSSWEALSKNLLEKGFSKEELIQSGLSLSKENRLLDRFRSRLIFPIHSFSARIIGFAARSLKSSSFNEAKYLNSPENEIYQKSKILYGIHQAKQAILRENLVYVVEGYIDVISLFQAGIENVVASGGTSLTKEQVYLLKRLTSNVVLLYDGDVAGREASIRATNLLLEEEINVSLISLPDGEDPDSFARKHSPGELSKFLKEEKENFINFRLKNSTQDLEDPLKKSSLMESILISISKVSNFVTREIYIQEVSKKLKISQEVLFSGLAQIQRLQKQKKTSTSKEVKLEVLSDSFFVDPLLINEQEIIKLLLCFGDKPIFLQDDDSKETKKTISSTVAFEIVKTFQSEDLKFSNNLYQRIFDKALFLYEKGEVFSSESFSQTFDEEIQSLLSSYLEPYSLANWESRGIVVKEKEANLSRWVNDALLRYKSNYLSKLIGDLGKELGRADEHQPYLLKKIIRLNKLKNAINLKLHRLV